MQVTSAWRKAILGLVMAGALAGAPVREMTVYKTPTCGCCGKWIAQLRAKGYVVTVKEVPSTAADRMRLGVPMSLASCHTGTIAGYSIEGHVPIEDIERLLKERPKAKGLAVPGMPMGSPGMENGPQRDAYAVILFGTPEGTKVYHQYEAIR